MKRRLLAMLLAMAMVLSLCACGGAPAESTPPATTQPPAPDPVELYAAARQPIDQAANRTMEVDTTRDIQVGIDSYSQVTDQTVELTGLGSDAVQVHLTEELRLDAAVSQYEEFFAEGKLYLSSADLSFQGEVEQEDYLAQFAPGVAVDASLYGQITMAEADGGYRITFQEPKAAEAWAVPQGAQFLNGKGMAQLDGEGTLVWTSYEAQYRWGGSLVEVNATIKTTAQDALTITLPDAAAYTQVEDVQAIRVADLAVCHLSRNQTFTSNSSSNIVLQVADCILSEATSVASYGTGSDHVSKVTSAVTLAQGGTAEGSTIEEFYRDGQLTTVQDGGEPEIVGFTPVEMIGYLDGLIFEASTNQRFTENVTMEVDNGLIWLDYTYNAELADILWDNINSRLFSDPEYLDSYVSNLKVLQAGGQWIIDQFTGYPLRFSSSYSCSHEFSGMTYVATVQEENGLRLSDPTVYESLTGEKLPEEQPQEAAKPLFYKVTGGDGQQMWLLGTIHVGDNRTAYLPQEIYDALDGAAALAVECNTIAYEEAVEQDPQAAMEMLQYYIYTDGTTTQSHLDGELYAQAQKLLKATGQYNAMMEMMKPAIWYSIIDQSFMDRGYSLVGDKGVDNRLMRRAMENGQQIWEVESVDAQMEMLTGFSEELQILMLESVVEADALESMNATQALYEAWCAGDAATILEALEASEGLESEDMTEEEKEKLEALMAEYNAAMNTERNDGMLTVAQEYLESGKVVFYAVGLAHLLDADNGLVTALQNAGYTVEQVLFQ